MSSHAASKLDLTHNDLACLAAGTWLNDECINFYLALLQVLQHSVGCSLWPTIIEPAFLRSAWHVTASLRLHITASKLFHALFSALVAEVQGLALLRSCGDYHPGASSCDAKQNPRGWFGQPAAHV